MEVYPMNIREMSAREIGDYSEYLFFQAIKNDKGPKPEWFAYVAQAAPILDLQGIDAFAYIRYPEFEGLIRVPIQIKTSFSATEDYFRRHPDAERSRVVVIHMRYQHKGSRVWHWQTEDYICRQLYRKLGEIWQDRVIFEGFIEKRLRNPVNERGEAILVEMRQRRRLNVPKGKVLKYEQMPVRRIWNRFLAKLRA